ncbi:hypothetical protein MMC30_001362 [Trapelia coarctata]|nr:hypothetical protein [Trapelia coarctata]
MVDPAPPILGLALLSATISNPKTAPDPASTGCITLDKALRGGFRYGEITSMAGASGMGKTLIALHAAASHLISCTKSEVAIIDTTGTFSPLRLRNVISHHISQLPTSESYRQSGYVYEKVPANAKAGSSESLQEKATVMLDRVHVMRVFDFPGVVEAIGEVSERCEEYDRLQNDGHRREAVDKPEVGNSDDGERGTVESEINAREHSLLGDIGMIIIDNISNVISSMMSKNQTSAQALLTTSLRSLHHLTTSHNICTLLLNAAVSLTPSTNSTYGNSFRPSDNASIFSSTNGRPALGRTYAFLIDTSVFLSSIPKTREDAEMAYGSSGDAAGRWKGVGILEVLKDRYGDREGGWGAFEMEPGGELVGYGQKL